MYICSGQDIHERKRNLITLPFSLLPFLFVTKSSSTFILRFGKDMSRGLDVRKQFRSTLERLVTHVTCLEGAK